VVKPPGILAEFDLILEGGSEGIFCYLAVNFFGLLFVFHCQAPSRTLTGQSGGFLRVTLLRPGGNRWFAARTSGCAPFAA